MYKQICGKQQFLITRASTTLDLLRPYTKPYHSHPNVAVALLFPLVQWELQTIRLVSLTVILHLIRKKR